ncbi:N-formylglutamate amidohydrolase [Tropicibacter naphthalenivorans]|uniref:N-formylglutamate deformylase n=1 Tax=Tropicibacter naphthalenivorans TaxID=441103 RepID=A0A0P1GL87_9RHOB|nr:N-formylglutamate amidohydrolase [Tropicibacter naphthalenivorans]CUH75461.1 N-formylglutamate deformylase [Tropicibacter naphthalenivorans]SMC44353.1 N-formylglutamate deformylase [Tropicibacter naphthalenivorans]
MPRVSYHLEMPENQLSRVVFASPHSGRDYPWSFLSQTILDETTIRSSEDAFVDRLYDCAPQFGAPFLRANAPRAYLDLNRSADELDPALIEGVRRVGHNPRVASGLGVIPRVVANGRAIYRGKLPKSEADGRIARIWKPYHEKLSELLTQTHGIFGEAILIDCHSMPREALDSTLRNSGPRPEIVIGDRFGASAAPEYVAQVEEAFASAGLRVARNAPFAGAYTTQHYGRPSRGQHAIQIEIDRSIYMDEAAIRPNADFPEVRKLLRGIVADVARLGLDGEQRLAAE